MTTTSPAYAWSSRLGAVQPRALVVGGLLVLEVLLGQLSVFYSPPGTQVAMFWPNAGISLVALLLAPRSWRAPVLAGVFVAAVSANLLGGRPADVSLAYGLANVVGAATAVWGLARRGRSRPELQTLDDFVRLVGMAFLSAATGAVVGALAVSVLTDGDPLATLRALVMSYATAILLVVPLALSVPRHAKQAGRVETVLQWSALFASIALIFQPEQELPLAFIPFPILVWGAVRLTTREVTVQLAALFSVVCVLTSTGRGPTVRTVQLAGAPLEMIGTLLQGQVLAAVLVALPLSLVKTQQQITVDRLTRSHKLVSNILDSTTATAILGTDLEGRIEFFNVGAERLSGYRAVDVIGRATLAMRDFGDGRMRLAIGVGEDPDTQRLEDLIGPFLDDADTSFTSDWDFVRRDGDVRTISVAVSRRYGDDGRPRGYLGVADDVTERRRHEAMVAAALETERQIVERLAQVDQTKNDFLSTVSHELRTPITSIIGYSQLLVSDDSGTLPAMHHQVISRIERNGRRLMGLIEDMLTMSQVEVGSVSFDRSPIDLRDAVLSAVESVQGLVATSATLLEVDLGPEAVQVQGDRDKLERVFVNLLSNAAKFSHAGDQVTICLGAEDGEAVARVVDHGIGISTEDRAHLFDRFFRGADAHALAIPGVGLGLPVAGSIVAGHDGRIEVDSELGQGSTFVVRLPLLAADSASDTAVTAVGTCPEAPSGGTGAAA